MGPRNIKVACTQSGNLASGMCPTCSQVCVMMTLLPATAMAPMGGNLHIRVQGLIGELQCRTVLSPNVEEAYRLQNWFRTWGAGSTSCSLSTAKSNAFVTAQLCCTLCSYPPKRRGRPMGLHCQPNMVCSLLCTQCIPRMSHHCHSISPSCSPSSTVSNP